jgi:nitroreductase
VNRRTVLLGGGALVLAGAGLIGLRRSVGSRREYDAAATALRRALEAEPSLPEIVRYATLAPNSHNTQPWRFRLGADRIEILPDLGRRTPVVDPDDHHLFISLGAAAETAAIAAAAHGRPAGIAFDPDDGGRLVLDLARGEPAESALYGAIPERQSTRAPYDARPVPVDDLGRLARAAAEPGTATLIVTAPEAIDRIAELVIEGNGRQIADPAFVRELKHWLRFNPRQAMATGDGLFSGASGNPALPGWLAGPVFDFAFTAESENDRYALHVGTAAGIAVFCAEADDPDHWTRVGRAFQRFALQATALGIRTAHVNQPVEVKELRAALAEAAGAPAALPFLAVRFGYGPTMPYSLRRPVAEVLV